MKLRLQYPSSHLASCSVCTGGRAHVGKWQCLDTGVPDTRRSARAPVALIEYARQTTRLCRCPCGKRPPPGARHPAGTARSDLRDRAHGCHQHHERRAFGLAVARPGGGKRATASPSPLPVGREPGGEGRRGAGHPGRCDARRLLGRAPRQRSRRCGCATRGRPGARPQPRGPDPCCKAWRNSAWPVTSWVCCRSRRWGAFSARSRPSASPSWRSNSGARPGSGTERSARLAHDAPLAAPADPAPCPSSWRRAPFESAASANPDVNAGRHGIDVARAERERTYRDRLPDFAVGRAQQPSR